MTEDLHPGLGSGALREALQKWQRKYFSAGISHEMWPNAVEHAFEAGWLAALSLSSPIEPQPYERASLGSTRTILVDPEHEDAARVYTPKGEVNVYWVSETPEHPAFMNVFIDSNKRDPKLEYPVQGYVDPATGTAHVSIGERPTPQASSEVREATTADFFLEHETAYTQLPSGRWAWECSCGDISEDFANWDDCHMKTRRHWADKLNAAPSRQGAVGE